MSTLPTVSVVIPTYNRNEVLINTINDLLELEHKASEILIIDQSLSHTTEVQKKLTEWHNNQSIQWVQISPPSIPNAMNKGTLLAQSEVVLFLDDDINTRSNLILEHAKAHLDINVNAVAGQVIQSWQEELDESQSAYLNDNQQDPDGFLFNSSKPCLVKRFMGGNTSFKRKDLLAVGGFDNNFFKVAYRFEAESAERFIRSGRVILFQPKASIRHLKVEAGGTRSYGDHLTSLSPAHTVGMYYYFLVAKNQSNRWWRFFSSPFSHCVTRFHLSKPWYIPVTFTSHLSGLIWAICLRIKGQKLISQDEINYHSKPRSNPNHSLNTKDEA